MTGSPICKCGHASYWHAARSAVESAVSIPNGACEITGPQPEDGCPCEQFRPTPAVVVPAEPTTTEATR